MKLKFFFRFCRMEESAPKGYENGHSVKLDIEGDFKIYSLRVPRGFDISHLEVKKFLVFFRKNIGENWTDDKNCLVDE